MTGHRVKIGSSGAVSALLVASLAACGSGSTSGESGPTGGHLATRQRQRSPRVILARGLPRALGRTEPFRAR
jgi:hypothetical protein